MATTATNVLDWATAYGFRPTRATLAAIAIPTLVLWGERSHPAVAPTNQLLAQCTAASQVAPLMTDTVSPRPALSVP